MWYLLFIVNTPNQNYIEHRENKLFETSLVWVGVNQQSTEPYSLCVTYLGGFLYDIINDITTFTTTP